MCQIGLSCGTSVETSWSWRVELLQVEKLDPNLSRHKEWRSLTTVCANTWPKLAVTLLHSSALIGPTAPQTQIVTSNLKVASLNL